MSLRKRTRTFSHTFGDPIIAKPDIIVAVRRAVQNACHHQEFRLVDTETLRAECTECGYQTPEIHSGPILKAIR